MKFRPYKGKKEKFCEAIVGQDPNSRQPHLIRCQNKAVGCYFASDEKTSIGAMLCQDCFEKISKDDIIREPIRQDLIRRAKEATKKAKVEKREEILSRLKMIIKEDSLEKWLDTPNVRFGNRTPNQLIDSDNTHSLWSMIYYLESGTPT